MVCSGLLDGCGGGATSPKPLPPRPDLPFFLAINEIDNRGGSIRLGPTTKHWDGSTAVRARQRLNSIRIMVVVSATSCARIPAARMYNAGREDPHRQRPGSRTGRADRRQTSPGDPHFLAGEVPGGTGLGQSLIPNPHLSFCWAHSRHAELFSLATLGSRARIRSKGLCLARVLLEGATLYVEPCEE